MIAETMVSIWELSNISSEILSVDIHISSHILILNTHISSQILSLDSNLSTQIPSVDTVSILTDTKTYQDNHPNR